ncbi:MAG TPA: ABC transporter ATP-binding protein [Planctomycetota bacterium]|jgi:ABC-2 type transport system ATP-binding protein|nr:ABC transporter ATP-binding protein [Planctomycetota bacterium]OQC20322.1 MAG: Daunorubicin/doxorubicin resistance ATP-binding protein DrrA [Planctomycetes bacterium ADurb.Bin069]NMD35962.1 ABC transporter ATP-binding protein [Planctomycetota bacterium]HNR98263.1 ABC transporter ATP-binding protein [Planctomycetota bacterium]HNU24869.1 ABC transporter ATP-binding protein [Planctomycetota bacterium]
MTEILRVTGVSKYFGAKRALDGIDLTLRSGDMYTLLGPNGAGKTTLLKLLCGLLRPTEGAIRIDGIALADDPVAAKRRMSYIPDHPTIFERLTGWEYLAFVAGTYRLAAAGWAEAAARLLDFFDLSAEARGLIGAYSHGMRQRLCFVAALLPDPALLLIDEPWVGLDPRHLRKAVEALRAAAARGTAVLLSTHSLALAEEIGGRIGILNQGRFLWDGRIENLLGEKERLEAVFLRLTEEKE